MRVCEGRLKDRVERGDVLIAGCVADSRSASVVEIYHDTGFDFLLIDREHTCLTDETITNHIMVARCLGFPSMVRVVEDNYCELNRTLDHGADGVFVPRVRTAEQVENIVSTVKYRPEGIRGLVGGGVPISKYKGWDSLTEQIDTVNRNTVVGIQIETAEALANLDEILSVKGVHIAVVGNDDLSIGMGIPGQTKTPEYIGQVERIIAACRKHGVLPGIACGDPDTAVSWIEKGMKCIWYSSDVNLFYQAASQGVQAIREHLPGPARCSGGGSGR
ncbi:MAG: hypothetical protein A2Z18_10575 [Armatimonadetes bacterium RBG_16_58_9]|nr:MAG: hypothetical protein A2Z18_10575 [Armatimonadetes bacterium RBG_16_58_9]